MMTNRDNLSFRKVDKTILPLLKHYWLQYFGGFDPSAIEYYFQHQFRFSKSYVLMLEDELIGSATLEPYTMELHGKVLQTTLIVGIFVVKQYRNQGYLSVMMECLLEYLKDKEVVTCIQEEIPGLYDRYGFEDVFNQNIWTIKRHMIEPMSSEGIRYVLDPQDCLDLYKYFTRYFTGYFKRDITYYEDLRREIHATKKQMLSFYKHNRLMATGLVTFDQNVGHVTELLYRDSQGLLTILNYFLALVPTLKVHTSRVEDLSKIIEGASFESSNWMKVRLNDLDSFNRLFKVNILSARSALNAFGRPLFNTQDS